MFQPIRGKFLTSKWGRHTLKSSCHLSIIKFSLNLPCLLHKKYMSSLNILDHTIHQQHKEHTKQTWLPSLNTLFYAISESLYLCLFCFISESLYIFVYFVSIIITLSYTTLEVHLYTSQFVYDIWFIRVMRKWITLLYDQ